MPFKDGQGEIDINQPAGPVRFWRGLGQNEEEGTRYQDQLLYSDEPYSGLGLVGNGTYFSYSDDVSRSFGNGVLREFYIEPDAEGVTYSDLLRMRQEFRNAMNSGRFEYLSAREWRALETIVNNLGTFATFLGFDYINNTNNYLAEIVLQNRGKLRAKGVN